MQNINLELLGKDVRRRIDSKLAPPVEGQPARVLMFQHFITKECAALVCAVGSPFDIGCREAELLREVFADGCPACVGLIAKYDIPRWPSLEGRVAYVRTAQPLYAPKQLCKTCKEIFLKGMVKQFVRHFGVWHGEEDIPFLLKMLEDIHVERCRYALLTPKQEGKANNAPVETAPAPRSVRGKRAAKVDGGNSAGGGSEAGDSQTG